MSDVSGIIKSIQDIMRKDVGVDGDAQRISQMVWMFFLKIFDDREAELDLLEKKFKSPLPEHLRWRAWAKDPEGMTGDELADFVNLQLFPTLKNKLNIQGPNGIRAMVVRDIFEDAYNYMKSGTLMRQVINKISEIDNGGRLTKYGKLIAQKSQFDKYYHSTADLLRQIHDRRNSLPGSHPYNEKGGAKNHWLKKWERNLLTNKVKNSLDQIANEVKKYS